MRGGGGVFSPSRNVSSIRVFINHTEAFRAAGTRVSHGEISLEFHLADALSDLGELAWIIFWGMTVVKQFWDDAEEKKQPQKLKCALYHLF